MATFCKSCRHTDSKRQRPRGPWDGSVATSTPNSTLLDAGKICRNAACQVVAIPLDAAGPYITCRIHEPNLYNPEDLTQLHGAPWR